MQKEEMEAVIPEVPPKPEETKLGADADSPLLDPETATQRLEMYECWRCSGL